MHNSVSPQQTTSISYPFSIRGHHSGGVIQLIRAPEEINQEISRVILVESFISEYQKYLTPQEIDEKLTSWRDGNHCVQAYYERYFKTELHDFSHGEIQYWVQATVDGQLAGWATFMREKSDNKALYMNLLVVHPDYQKKGIGEQLVKSLLNLAVIPDLTAINLLIRKKNHGGKIFYSKLGFKFNPNYMRDGNFVDLALLEGLTWNNPALLQKNAPTKCWHSLLSCFGITTSDRTQQNKITPLENRANTLKNG